MYDGAACPTVADATSGRAGSRDPDRPAGQAPEIEAAAVVSFDGLPMASALPAGMDEDRVAAMSAALLSPRASAPPQGLGRGELSQVYVEGEAGTVFLVSADDEAVLVAVAARAPRPASCSSRCAGHGQAVAGAATLPGHEPARRGACAASRPGRARRRARAESRACVPASAPRPRVARRAAPRPLAGRLAQAPRCPDARRPVPAAARRLVLTPTDPDPTDRAEERDADREARRLARRVQPPRRLPAAGSLTEEVRSAAPGPAARSDGVVFFGGGRHRRLLGRAPAVPGPPAGRLRAVRRGAARCVEAVAAVSGGSVGVARALRGGRRVSSRAAAAGRTEQAVDAVFDLLRWPEGDFAFDVDEPNPDDVGVALTPSRSSPRPPGPQGRPGSRCRGSCPSPDVVLAMPVVSADDAAVGRDEWALLALVDGPSHRARARRAHRRGQFAVVSTLAHLVQRGLAGACRTTASPDHVSPVASAQLLLAPLEAAAEARAAETSPAAPAACLVRSRWPASRVRPLRRLARSSHAAAVAGSPAGRRRPPAASAGVPLLGGAHAPARGRAAAARAVPARRPVEHPEPAPARGGFSAPLRGGRGRPPLVRRGRRQGAQARGFSAGGAAADQQADPIIERDPGVNRSLLLRLIAGVRGL